MAHGIGIGAMQGESAKNPAPSGEPYLARDNPLIDVSKRFLHLIDKNKA